MFLWSWVLTLPFVVLGSFVAYKAVDRFDNFMVRYDSAPFGNINLHSSAKYEIEALIHKFRVGLSNFQHPRSFETIELFIPQANIALLESHMPQSGFEYVNARMVIDKRLVKVKVKYRGDFQQHWAWNKKSWRIKTDKDRLFESIRTFNLQAPKAAEQLNNFLALQLANALHVVAPETRLVELIINRESMGLYVYVEQLREETLRHQNLMPADIYRGELLSKDKFIDSGVRDLFRTSAVWDKMSVNNHYAENSMAPLKRLLELIDELDSASDVTDPQLLATTQKSFAELMDMDAWAAFSVFEALAQTRHFDPYHNWRLYYDPWRQKFIPIAWDPGGWPKAWRASSEQTASAYVISTALHRALFRDGSFIRKRNRVLQDFFKSGNAENFLDLVDRTIVKVRGNIFHDPHIRPPRPMQVNTALDALEAYIHKTFTDLEQHLVASENATQLWFEGGRVYLAAQDLNPIRLIQLEYANPLSGKMEASVNYVTSDGPHTLDTQALNQLTPNTIVLKTSLVAEIEDSYNTGETFPMVMAFPAIYSIAITGTNNQLPDRVLIDHGNGLKQIMPGASFIPKLVITEQAQNRIDNIDLRNWQLFWGTGSGFSAKNSKKIRKLNLTPGSEYRSLTHRIPAEAKRIRIDLPTKSKSILSDITVEINGEKHVVPISLLSSNQMSIDENTIRATGGNDPYFSFPLAKLTERVRKGKQKMTIGFNLLAYTPLTRYQERITDKSLGEINSIYNPAEDTKEPPMLVWQGDITVQKTMVIEHPLTIKPGTRLLMGPGASLILKNKTIANGTPQQPITVKAIDVDQKPWGTIALLGKAASNSSFKNCSFNGGSGLKGDLFEYTAMFSVHDVKNMLVEDCTFSNSRITDDMVHVVYSDIRFTRTHFTNANLDALDIDMSKAVIEDSVFQNSGNDAIDLMTSYAEVYNSTLQYNGDKAISVGENSQLLGVELVINNNLIGVQSKDASQAILFNSNLFDNDKALDAYKKNWRYDRGGSIFVSKSSLRKNKSSLSTGIRSQINLFDSYLDKPPTSKPAKGRIRIEGVDSLSNVSETSTLYGKQSGSTETRALLDALPDKFLHRITLDSRGAHYAI